MATDATHDEAADPSSPPKAIDKRHAIVFVPGLGDTWVNQSISTIGAKLASALDNQAGTPSAVFTTEVWQEAYGSSGHTAPACTIHRRDAGADAAVIDVFRLDSVRELRSRWDGHSLIVKMLLPVLLLALYVPRALRHRKADGKTRRDRLQFFYALSIAALVSAYVVLVAFSILALTPVDVTPVNDAIAPTLALLLTLIGLSKAQAVKGVTDGAVGYLSVMSYFRYGDRREQLVGNLARLLQHLGEREKVAYDRVDIVGYSFGSIIALDGLFPPRGRSVHTFAVVNQLVTVGCPFDFVRTYWPHYFDDRKQDNKEKGKKCRPLKCWQNIYLPIDVLSSNFRNNNEPGDATVGIPTNGPDGRKPQNIVYDEPSFPDELGFSDFIILQGLRSHDFYWGSETSSDLGVFPVIVDNLFKGDKVLS